MTEWVLVPREPTPEMQNDGAMQYAMTHQRVQTAESSATQIYRAMLQAAPQAEPVAWLCELAQEDGSVRRMIVEEDPAGLRFNDIGEPSPFRVTPLYAGESK